MENNKAYEPNKSNLIDQIEDWSSYLQKIVHLEKEVNHLMNLKRYEEAENLLAEIGHNSRMARVWIYYQENKNV